MGGRAMAVKRKTTAAAVPVHKSLAKQMMKHWEFYLLLLPGIILTIIFKYRFTAYRSRFGITTRWKDFSEAPGWG